MSMSNGTCCSASQRMTSRASASFMRSMVIFLTITSRPPTAVTTDLVLIPARGHETLDGLGHDARVHDFALDDRVVADRGERHLGQHRTTGGVGNGDELDQAASDVQPDRHRLAPEESHTCPLVGETSGYLALQRATDVPHKLHFGNPLQAKHVNPGISRTFLRFGRPHLLFRKRSLGMQQWTL